MENKDTSVILDGKSSGGTDAVAGLIVELLGGILFFLPGLGHVLSGKVLQGTLILLGGYAFWVASAVLGIITFGCTYIFSIPVYLGGVIFSAVSVFKYMEKNRLKADWKSFLIFIGVILGIIIFLGIFIVLISVVFPMIFLAFSNS